jgi:hypothetical protein
MRATMQRNDHQRIKPSGGDLISIAAAGSMLM